MELSYVEQGSFQSIPASILGRLSPYIEQKTLKTTEKWLKLAKSGRSSEILE